jgi:hypothetical protein
MFWAATLQPDLEFDDVNGTLNATSFNVFFGLTVGFSTVMIGIFRKNKSRLIYNATNLAS